ncbi:MAG: phosphotransferase, partial [Planctomycetota bacterium]|nr:phosphotransferase [Planctomycetota bacterium]
FHDLVSRISQLGCEVIAVPLLPVLSSAAAITPWFKDGENIWQMEPWMTGKFKNGLEVTQPQLKSALMTLDRFHRLAAAAVPGIAKIGASDWFRNTLSQSPAVHRRLNIVRELQNGVLGSLRQQLNNDCDQQFRESGMRVCKCLQTWLPWLNKELTALAVIPFPLQPVLRDIWRAHILFTEDHVTGLIDLSAAASDHVTLDVTRLLRSWYGSDVGRIQNAILEYQSLRLLNVNERRLLQALDAATVLLSPVTWLRRRSESDINLECAGDIIARFTELACVAAGFSPLIIDTNPLLLPDS